MPKVAGSMGNATAGTLSLANPTPTRCGQAAPDGSEERTKSTGSGELRVLHIWLWPAVDPTSSTPESTSVLSQLSTVSVVATLAFFWQ